MPDTEQMKAELLAAGWIAKTNVIWKCPQGFLYIGPYGAWKWMKSQSNVRPEGVHAT